MDNLMLLWINFTRSQTPPEVLRELGAKFTVNWLPGGQALDENVLPSEPCIACFDFDDPSPEGLATLSEFKLRHPSIPILMLSLHHDTALVLWALRARVWNFFPKPIRAGESVSQARVFAAAPMTHGGSEIPPHTEQKNPVAAQKYASGGRASRR